MKIFRRLVDFARKLTLGEQGVKDLIMITPPDKGFHNI